MKRLIIIFSFLFLLPVFAQAQMDALKIILALKQMKVFVDYKKFATDFEKMVLDTKDVYEISENDKDLLQLSYNDAKRSYDEFLGIIRADLMDYKTIKKMIKKPRKFARRYEKAFLKTNQNFQTNFLKTYKEITARSTMKKRAIISIPILIELGVEAFNLIAGLISKRKNYSDDAINSLLIVVNGKFFSPLELKTWEELTGENKSKLEENITEEKSKFEKNTNTYVSLSYPIMKRLKGEIEFIEHYKNGKTPMLFIRKRQRNLSVGSKNIQFKTPEIFVSKKKYYSRTSFQIRVKNTALMYVFALNEDGSFVNIYPFNKEFMRAFNMETRNINIGPKMFQNKKGYTIIPSKNATTGEQNYINISGSSKKETLCILISKSELDMKKIERKILRTKGNLISRLNKIFKHQTLNLEEINMQNKNGKIIFDAKETSKKILPFVFEIRRN